jgi:prepilin-type N-terminal cleavage/methylation domain-containing protein
MPVPARPSLCDARGFTMVEALVVVLIIGILTVIALPAFIGQRMRGQDTEAQQTLRTVATALEAYYSDKETYDASRAELVAIEPALSEATDDLDIEGDARSFRITERSASRTTFTLTRDENANFDRTCSAADRGLCRSDLHW